MVNIKESIERLKIGNEKFLHSRNEIGDISEAIRMDTAKNGQHPFAIIITCSDSRVIPEAIFSCGVGELFVIRTAGNVVDDSALGSIEYAVEHLNCPLIVILGHTNCGAVGAAIAGNAGGYVKNITDKIAKVIGSEKDPCRASVINIKSTVSCIRVAFADNEEMANADVVGALYDIENGKVTFLENNLQNLLN
ncbi:MAG: carbonic anhydrase [Clostridiaceae bacterium]|nr:carbonic anhydrase [Clostridiaceae bacterium]